MTDEHERRRLARLREELLDAGVALPDATSDVLLEEIGHARWGGVHERRRMEFGALVGEGDLRPNPGATPMFASAAAAPFRVLAGLGSAPPDALRAYADGRTTFLLRAADGRSGLVALSATDELELTNLSRRHGVSAVRRCSDGTVVLHLDDVIVTLRDGRWSVRPDTSGVVRVLRERLSIAPPEVLAALLDLSLHVLSPSGTGTILVWRVIGSSHERLTRPGSPPPFPMSVLDPDHTEALVKRVALGDGACLIDPDGTVARIGSYLGWTQRAERLVPASGGMRHISARWHSFEVPEVVCFVVSEDGPVTIYSDGADVLGDRPHLSGERPVERVRCRRCATPLRVERRHGAAAAITCPVCEVGLGEGIGAVAVSKVLSLVDAPAATDLTIGDLPTLP